MSTDLRTELNDADTVTSWVSDGASPAVNTLTGQRYEGTGSIDGQHTNSDEATYTTAIGGTRDLSDATVYALLKDNLVDTFANGGVQMMLTDGTDRIGYDVGGNDAVGLPLEPFFNAYKLDVSVIVATPGSFATYSGSEANLAHASITGVGFGTLHLAKAQGNVPNIFIDRMTFIANDSYALRINGGTVGTPETMADVQGDDATNGWGMVNNPQGSQYGFFAPTEWGEPVANADSYFEANNEQWFLIGDNGGGHAVGANHFPFRVVGNATDTISHVLNNVVIVNLGTRAQIDYSDANVDITKFTAVTWTDTGTITFPAQVANDKFANDVIFNNCDQVYFDTLDVDGATFNGANDANGAILWDENANPSNQDNVTLNSDGTGHAVYINLTGDGPGAGGAFDFAIDGWEVSGYETADDGSTGNTVFLVDNDNDNDVNITVTNGVGTFSYERAAGYTGTVTISQAVTVKYTFLDESTNAAIQGVNVILGTTVGGSDVIDNVLSDVNGEVEVTYTGATPQATFGFGAKGTRSPVYKRKPIDVTIGANGVDQVITLVGDGA